MFCPADEVSFFALLNSPQKLMLCEEKEQLLEVMRRRSKPRVSCGFHRSRSCNTGKKTCRIRFIDPRRSRARCQVATLHVRFISVLNDSIFWLMHECFYSFPGIA